MNLIDPNKKNEQQNESSENESLNEGVYVYNADGTPMDTGDRTYISTDLPEEDSADETGGE